MRRLKTVRRPPIYPKTPGHLPCSSLTHPLPLSSRRLSVSFGGFGISARDLLHAAVMRRLGADRVISVDVDFDYLPDVTRLDPADLAEWGQDV